MKIVALIPARSKSKRLPHKNILPLGNKPLLAHTIEPAIESKLFVDVIVSSDSEKYLHIAKNYGASVILRPEEFAQDNSTDFEWINHVLQINKNKGYEAFCLLRPTNPFRTVAMLKKAIFKFEKLSGMNYLRTDFSLRAVENCKQHPCKMWSLHGSKIIPVYGSPSMKLFTQPYDKLPSILVQNASLEMGFTSTVFDRKSHTEETIYPFFTEGIEGFDINTEEDYLMAKILIEKRKKNEI